MSMNKKAKKNLIIATVTSILVVGFALGLWFFVQYQSDRKTVEVVPMMNVTTQYWGDQAYSSGTAASENLQEIYPSSDQTVSEIFVTEGQQVSVGDPLVQYDKTKLELDQETKDLAVKQAEIQLEDAEEQLDKLRKTTPISTPGPTKDPVIVPTPEPATPTPTPTPTPEPSTSTDPTPTPEPTVKPADVTLYSRLDGDSLPYQGSGTTEDPYVFLCTENCTMTRDFLRLLLGLDQEDGATPPPDQVLYSPFAAIFEVREGNSNYGDLLYSFQLDGTQLSGNFEDVEEELEQSPTLETVADVFQATTQKSTPTPTPKPNSNNYDDMGYTKEELQDLIAQKRQEIKDLQLQVKQAKLDLEKAQIALDNSTVHSTVDGVVRTLIDVDSAKADNSPFLVVSGQGQFTITGVLSESFLTSIHVGDTVTAMSYDNGMSYSATISKIADYPLENASGMYGAGNPNSSQYEFTAVVDNPEGLTNGSYLEITLNVQGETSTDAIYLWKAYLRQDEGGSYVMKAGIDNRLYKQYLEVGASIYNGEYVEVKSGLTMEDYIAFPYGPDVKEGVRVLVEGTDEPPISEDGSGENLPEEDGTDSQEGIATADTDTVMEVMPE